MARTTEFIEARKQVESLDDNGLWAILRSGIHGELGANRLTWAKTELKRRRLLPEAAA